MSKNIFVFFIVGSLFFLFVVLLLYFFFIKDSGGDIDKRPLTDPTKKTLIGDQLGLESIDITEQPIFSFPEDVGEIDDSRDDRIYTAPNRPNEDTLQSLPRLVRLFKGPTAGYRVDRADADSWEIRVIEQGRGNRYSIRTAPYTLNLIAAGEFTKVLEGYIFSNDTSLILYESGEDEFTVKSAFVPFAPVGGNDGIQLFENNIRVATDNETNLFFIREVDDRVIGIVVDVSNPEKTEIVWESHFTNWLPRWGRNDYITISTPISKYARGYVYLVDPAGKVPINRFVDISSGGSALVDTTSGFFVLYESVPGSFVGKTLVTDQSRKTSIALPSTVPEKCDGFNGVFVCAVPNSVPSSTLSGYETVFPDSWYQGDITLSDSVIQIDAVTGEKKLIMSPDQDDIKLLSGNEAFDIIRPTVSDDGEFFIFVNKNDLSLWMLRL